MISRSAPPPLEPALVEEGVESLAEILAHEHGGVCRQDQIALVVCVVKAGLADALVQPISGRERMALLRR
jgi:hypothetical protein